MVNGIMIMFKMILLMMAVKMSSSKTSSRVSEGYPLGYISDCPGSNKEARISPRSLRKLAFVLYTPSSISNVGNLTSYNYYQMKSLSKHLDFHKKTVLYVTGYGDSNYLTPQSLSMGAVYKRLRYNVLTLEYIAFTTWVFPRAARLLRPVGKHTGEMLAELTKLGLDPKMLEIIGISLGGQAVSFIGKNYQRITGRNLSRITALDPSGPCFRHNGPEDRIDASDADFVEIIHTNIDGYGLAAAVGHVDFYINGGENQPGDFETLPCVNACSHLRSFTLWVGALLNPNSFIGMQCDSVQEARDRNCFDRKPFITNVLGLNVDKSKHGIFYVMSDSQFPYSMEGRGLIKKFEVYKRMIGSYNNPDIINL